LKKKILNYLFDKLKAFRYYERVQQLSKLKSAPNTFIHDNLFLGDYTNMNILDGIKELRIGEDVSTRRFCNFMIYPNSTLIIHRGVFFNNYCSVNCLGFIEIGENTIFGEAVKIYDHNHSYSYQEDQLIVERDKFKTGFVKIGKNCWIGSNVTILNNVEIGDNVIIGANCLIYKSIPANSIVKLNAGYVVSNQGK
jgi:acetyltransferase-like isoleucine patch superfamily enzyme